MKKHSPTIFFFLISEVRVCMMKSENIVSMSSYSALTHSNTWIWYNIITYLERYGRLYLRCLVTLTRTDLRHGWKFGNELVRFAQMPSGGKYLLHRVVVWIILCAYQDTIFYMGHIIRTAIVDQQRGIGKV